MNKLGVSAVIGVILIVAITVAIAATVFVYISEYRMNQEDESISGNIKSISGNITEKYVFGSPGYNQLDYWFILDDNIEVEVNITIYYSYDIDEFYCDTCPN